MMLAMRLLSAARGGSDEKDIRTVDSVLAAAAKRLGEPSMPDASRQLEANGVKFAWQMAHFSDNDWDQLGVPLGIKLAAKAELADPTASAKADSAQKHKPREELSDRMRRFLLLPEADGDEAKPLGEMSAIFMGLLATPIADRQSLLLALCELMALISGLFVSAPFDFRTTIIASAPLDAAPETNTWLVPPTLADGRDALIGLIYLLDIHVGVFSVAMALYVAAAGFNADDSFSEGVMHVLGPLTTIFNVGVFFPLVALCFWQLFTDATSPYLMLANVLVVFLFHNVVGGRVQRFFAEALPLELYHFPKGALAFLRSQAGHMGTAHLLSEKALKAAAERRAAKLRAQMTLDDSEHDRHGGAACFAESDAGRPRGTAAAEMESRTRRHLRVVAVNS